MVIQTRILDTILLLTAIFYFPKVKRLSTRSFTASTKGVQQGGGKVSICNLSHPPFVETNASYLQ